MSATPIFVAGYRNSIMQLTAEFTTFPRILWAPTQAGQAAIPGKINLGLGLTVNGSRLHACNASNNDSNPYSITIGIGTVLTLNSTMGSPTITNQNQINRFSGFFATDGWRVGDMVYLQGSTAIGNDKVLPINSFPTTQEIAFLGTPLTNDGAFAGNLILLSNLTTVNVPANAGNSTSVPSVDLLQPGQLPVVFSGSDKFLVLGPNDVLVAFSNTTITSGSGKVVSITTSGGDY